MIDSFYPNLYSGILKDVINENHLLCDLFVGFGITFNAVIFLSNVPKLVNPFDAKLKLSRIKDREIHLNILEHVSKSDGSFPAIVYFQGQDLATYLGVKKS